MKNLIVGYGVVGNNLHKELKKLPHEIYDKNKHIYPEDNFHNIAFVCVPTELKEDGLLDISIVEEVINKINANIFVIKSTIPVGTTDKLKEKYSNKRIVFSPEYYGGTQHCNNFDFNFTILGGDKKDCLEVQQELQKVYDGRHIFKIVDAKTAELAKFMENSWLAYKVTFCVEFYKICQQLGLDYEDLRELFILDPRVNPSHTFVYNDHPYFSSHCLDKDVPSIANQMNSELLQSILDINEKNKKYKQ